jgi:hypothetical protein
MGITHGINGPILWNRNLVTRYHSDSETWKGTVVTDEPVSKEDLEQMNLEGVFYVGHVGYFVDHDNPCLIHVSGILIYGKE